MYWIEHSDIYTKTIAVDWLEIFGEIDNWLLYKREFKKMTIEQWNIALSTTHHAQYNGYGTSTFEQSFKIYCEGTLIGELYTNPRIKNGHFNEKSAGFKLANNLLYCENYLELLRDFVDKCGFQFSNVTRLDVAMDGCNHMLKFFTKFTAGFINEADKHYMVKVGRAEMMPKALNMEFAYFDGFQVGSRKSDKHVIIYNKTKEIANSMKTYIMEYWTLAGIPQSEFNYMIRTEVSLKSKLLSGYNLDNLSLLRDTQHIVSLFQKETAPYLDFRYNIHDKNISRYPAHALIDYRQVKLTTLPKAVMKERDGLYMAKMTVHSCFQQMCKGLANDDINDYAKTIENTVMQYGLEDWFTKKREQWRALYKCHSHTGHVYELTQL